MLCKYPGKKFFLMGKAVKRLSEENKCVSYRPLSSSLQKQEKEKDYTVDIMEGSLNW